MPSYIGGYLYPYTILANIDVDRQGIEYEILDEMEVNGITIIINRSGGLFTIVPDELIGKKTDENGHILYSHIKSQENFEQGVCDSFNHFACELSLRGLTTCAFSPSFLGIGKKEGNKIWITTACSSPSSAFERVIGPHFKDNHEQRVMALFTGGMQIFVNSRGMLLTKRLANISKALPFYILSAYSQFQQHQIHEAIVDAWIACEQIIDYLWNSHIDRIEDKKRIDRLKDTRTYSVAVRLEILFNIGVINEELYSLLNNARKHRNDIAHRAETNIEKSFETMLALHKLIEYIVGEKVSGPPTGTGPLWSFDIDRMSKS
jgi:hypothetical protein